MTDEPTASEHSATPLGPAALRREAEARAREDVTDRTGPQSALQAQRLIHELRVHQIELEMQNDELQRALVQLEDEQKLQIARVEKLDRLKNLMQTREGRMAELKHRNAQLEDSISGLPGGDQVLATLRDASVVVPQLRYSRASGSSLGSSDSESEQRALLNLIEDLESVEKLRALDQMKDRFVAMASHEMRTPLTTVAGFSSTLLHRWDEISDEDKRTYVGHIDEQANRMIRLVNNVLIMSRVHTGALDINAVPIDLTQAIDRVLKSFPGISISVNCPVDAQAYVDSDHLQQALVNYLANAVRYGSPPIGIDVLEGPGGVDIRVSDHGRGVSDEFVPQLFEEFAQAPEHQVSGRTGSGLGLSIVRRLMTAQGGDAWYEPNEPEGACFCLRLPAEAV